MIREFVVLSFCEQNVLRLSTFNSYITHPEKPKVNYPECFQSRQISVHGPTVAKLIEDRVASADVPQH